MINSGEIPLIRDNTGATVFWQLRSRQARRPQPRETAVRLGTSEEGLVFTVLLAQSREPSLRSERPR